MKQAKLLRWYIPTVVIVLLILIAGSVTLNRSLTTASNQALQPDRICIVIDAGHGEPDGGAVSCTGVLESQINLQIALKLNDLFHLLGYQTKMIRTDEHSVYTNGTTIAQKKVSDIKERLRIINSTPNALLISIHQNQFQDSQYKGAQVFYPNTNGSNLLAKAIQQDLSTYLDPENSRKVKKCSGVYLMDRISCTGVLIECGFLSNPSEERMLRNNDYQNKLCAVISTCICVFLDRENTS